MRKAEEHSTLFGGWRGHFAHIVARLLPAGINWYRGNPIVSFTFDDFPLSAAQIAGPLLKSHGVCGTFYAATGLMGASHELWPMATRDVLRSLEAEGHEIGLHTHSHKRAWEYDAAAFQADLALNEVSIRSEIGSYRPESFAYPDGIGHFGHKRWLAKAVRGSRSIHPGINAGFIDTHFLRAYELTDSALSPSDAAELIDSAVEDRGWLIFVSHDVAKHPSPFGVTPELLESAILHAKARGAAILPVCEALDRVGVALNATSFSTEEREGRQSR